MFSGCCREDCANTYIIEGVVSEQSTNLPCIGFEIKLKEQILENGVLNATISGYTNSISKIIISDDPDCSIGDVLGMCAENIEADINYSIDLSFCLE